jgi:hypothetical protein
LGRLAASRGPVGDVDDDPHVADRPLPGKDRHMNTTARGSAAQQTAATAEPDTGTTQPTSTIESGPTRATMPTTILQVAANLRHRATDLKLIRTRSIAEDEAPDHPGGVIAERLANNHRHVLVNSGPLEILFNEWKKADAAHCFSTPDLADLAVRDWQTNDQELLRILHELKNKHRLDCWSNDPNNNTLQHVTMDSVADALEAVGRNAGAGKTKNHRGVGQRRRRRQQRGPTPKQLEAVQIVGECNGNIAEAARQLGRDAKTVSELYRKGLKNAGSLTISRRNRPRTGSIPTDARGQVGISSADKGPAANNPNADPARDRRPEML